MTATDDGVALRLLRLATPAAAAWADRGLLNPTLRAALLIDLALNGALIDGPGGLEIDTSPTSFEPTDRMLTAIVDEPERPLQWWLYHAPVDVHDLAGTLVARHIWQHHGPLRRYRDVDPRATQAALNRLRAATRRQPCPPQTFAVAALIGVVNPASFVGAATGKYGAADWLVPDLIAHLQERKRLLRAAARDASRTTAIQNL